MKEKITEETSKSSTSGITLIALVVTIIVLIILSVISINIILGEDGIVQKSESAKEEMEAGTLKEKINLSIINYSAKKETNKGITIGDLWQDLVDGDIIYSINDIDGPDDDNLYIITATNNYEVEIVVDENADAKVKDVYKTEKTRIRKVETIVTETSIHAEVVARNMEEEDEVIFLYKLATEADTEYKNMTKESDFVANATGLTGETEYDIQVKIVDKDEKIKAQKNITVKTDAILVKEIALNKTSATVANSVTLQLTKTISPSNASNQTVTWSSSNEAVAVVNENGLVTMKSAGNVTITVKANDAGGKTATCSISVLENVANLTSIQTVNRRVMDDYGNLITVPKDFKVVPSQGRTANKGIVIQDSEGNQFVWIPINNVKYNSSGSYRTITLGRYTFSSATSTKGKETLVQSADVYTSSSSEYEIGGQRSIELQSSRTANTVSLSLANFVDRTKQNNGYYIARYEASKGSDGKADSMANKTAWVNLTQPTAASAGRNMYSSNSYYVSDLVNSYSWDTALVFIQAFSGDSDYSYKTPGIGSLMLTGQTGEKACNIYDMPGNIAEWTTETVLDDGYTKYTLTSTSRGGQYQWATQRGAYYRGYGGTISGYSQYEGFRTLLYVTLP